MLWAIGKFNKNSKNIPNCGDKTLFSFMKFLCFFIHSFLFIVALNLLTRTLFLYLCWNTIFEFDSIRILVNNFLNLIIEPNRVDKQRSIEFINNIIWKSSVIESKSINSIVYCHALFSFCAWSFPYRYSFDTSWQCIVFSLT